MTIFKSYKLPKHALIVSDVPKPVIYRDNRGIPPSVVIYVGKQ